MVRYGKRENVARRAFTMIEMLVVIAIIGLLVGMLFPAISAALKTARKVQAFAEVEALETAWLQHYAAYERLPEFVEDEDATKIEDDVAAVLDPGLRQNPSEVDPSNPRRTAFMEFKNENVTNGMPLTVHARKDPSVLSGCPDEACYYVHFDADYDGYIPGVIDNDGTGTQRIRARVAVYCYNTDYGDGNEKRIIGSWQK